MKKIFLLVAIFFISVNFVKAEVADFSQSQNRTLNHDYVQDLTRPNTFRNTQGKEFAGDDPINTKPFGQQAGLPLPIEPDV
ncbi:hypothetical protein IJF81_01545, partial [bacterium]|nr:hypothetical protein [bacterium]